MDSLPIFPLPIAVCPHEIVPLHIFEDRFKRLIHDCLSLEKAGGSGEFVIAYSDNQAIADVGCVVRLLKVIKHYEDGRMDVVVAGRRRVAIHGVEAGDPCQQSAITLYHDTRADWNEDLANKAYHLHRAVIHAITGSMPEDRHYAGISDLSFLLASSLEMDVELRQKILVSQCEDERLNMLISAMKSLMCQIERVQVAARSIQGHWLLQQSFGSVAGTP
ncbi:MAG TPA: LON peptidase substrate-binding domain-containing protein [Kiritimatiellia bacterium]|nr:LON peptidase substrate-binding domain-containing protein [Kiritimatiellia bacterium]